jgi:hypothetical protein
MSAVLVEILIITGVRDNPGFVVFDIPARRTFPDVKINL